MQNNGLIIDQRDNVAIAIQPIDKGGSVVVGGERQFIVLQDIAESHKVALAPIKTGELVIRYGEPIVKATMNIQRGEWVHVHNTEPIKGA